MKNVIAFTYCIFLFYLLQDKQEQTPGAIPFRAPIHSAVITEHSMQPNQEKPGEKKTSRKAAGITIAILLCLVLAGGVFVMSGRLPAPDSPGQGEKSAAPESTSDSFSGSLRDWLGIDTVLSILNPGGGYTVVKADPSAIQAVTDSTAKESVSASASGDAGAGSGQNPSGTTGDAPDQSADLSSATPAADGAADSSVDSPAGDPAAAAGANASDPAAAAVSADTGGTAASADPDKKAEEKKKEETAEKKEEKKEASPTKLQKKYIKAWEEWHMRDFPENFPLHNYNWKYLSYDESGILRYEGDDQYMIRRGIDVSEFQGKIDWEKVKEAGYDFVFVRVGHRTMHTGDLKRDSRAIKNLTRAKKAGLDVGAYVFSQAVSKKEARREAQLCLDVIEESGVEITLPIVFDPEIVIEDYYARINFISGEQFTDNAVAFCETIREAGYTPAIYANCSTETDILDMSRLKGTTIWYADYSGSPETPYDFTFWQYSNLGWVDGIPETETDLNVWFIKK